MHIAFNGLRLSGQRFGVGRYIEYLLKYWARQLGPDEHVTVFLRGRADTADLPDRRITYCSLPPYFNGTVWENLALSRAARSADVLFGPSYTAPLIGRTPPLVVVTHSVDEARPGTHSWWRNQTHARLYRAAARRARAVIVPSTDTRDAVVQLYGVAPERVHILPLGVDTEVFRPLAGDPRIDEVRGRYVGDGPYVLFVGKMSKRRNVPLLLEAFRQFKRRGFPHKLLLFGPNHQHLPLDRLIARLDLQDTVVQDDGRIPSHEALVPIYAGADLLVHPTSFDSSSLPVLEAMASGLPVVTMRTGGLTEAFDGAALLLSEWTASALADAMEQVITDMSLRATLVDGGLARAEDRSWRSTAHASLAIVRAVVRNESPPGGRAV